MNIGRYEVKGEIGRGGMATVVLAHDPAVNRDVAIKLLPRQFVDDAAFRARFVREASIIASLEHSAILPIYDFGEESGQPYIVMRYMPGGSLADRLRAGPMREHQVVPILERVSQALDEAHSRNIVHRDVKPANILFSRHDEPFLGDFGIARLVESTMTSSFTGIVGTPAYMSPEQALGKPASPASDVYALGAVAYEMLTGRPPFAADNLVAIALKHVNEEPLPPRDLNPSILPEVQAVILRAMQKAPEDRYQSAGEFARELRHAAAAPAPSPVPIPYRDDETERFPPIPEPAPEPVPAPRPEPPPRLREQDSTRREAEYTPSPWRWIAATALVLAVIGTFLPWEGELDDNAWQLDAIKFGALRPWMGATLVLIAAIAGGAGMIARRQVALAEWVLPGSAGLVIAAVGLYAISETRPDEFALERPAAGTYLTTLAGLVTIAASLGLLSRRRFGAAAANITVAGGLALAFAASFMPWDEKVVSTTPWSGTRDFGDGPFVLWLMARFETFNRLDAYLILLLVLAGAAGLVMSIKYSQALGGMMTAGAGLAIAGLGLIEMWHLENSEFVSVHAEPAIGLYLFTASGLVVLSAPVLQRVFARQATPTAAFVEGLQQTP